MAYEVGSICLFSLSEWSSDTLRMNTSGIKQVTWTQIDRSTTVVCSSIGPKSSHELCDRFLYMTDDGY